MRRSLDMMGQNNLDISRIAFLLNVETSLLFVPSSSQSPYTRPRVNIH